MHHCSLLPPHPHQPFVFTPVASFACCPFLPPPPRADTALSSDNRFLLYSSITPEVHLASWAARRPAKA